jgi:hypothetical protein
MERDKGSWEQQLPNVRKERNDIDFSVAILQAVLFKRLWENQWDPEKIPYASGSDILHLLMQGPRGSGR